MSVRTRRSPPLVRAAWRLVVVLGLAASPALAQDTVPVTVSDSPVAWQLLQQANDQARDNPGEAARICQRLLDGYGDKLVPADDPPGDRFEGVVDRVERFLRLHPSVLERYRQVETPEAERRVASDPSLAKAASVARTHGLTSVGLRAHLALAESDIYAGRLGQAMLRLARLESHPDLAGGGPEATTYWTLQGLATTLAGKDRREADARLRALQRDDANQALAALEALGEVGPLPIPPATSPLESGSPPTSEERGWQPVWSEPLGATPYARWDFGRVDSPLGFSPREIERARYDGSMCVVAPTVVGDVVLVSDGSTVQALDRLSHRVLWASSIGLGLMDRAGGPLGDMASVAVGEGAVVAFPGHALGNERGPTGRVVCLELETGAERWDVSLPALRGEEFEEIFPIGEPVIADGAVFLLARKVTSRLETVEYALALDLATGALRWATHVSSCGGVRLQGLRSCSRPVVADGSVWVATSVGAMARLDAGDGRIQWLHRFLVPIRDARYQTEPWELGGPVFAGDWVFAVAPDQSEVIQLERATGRLVKSFPTGVNTAWGTPRYLVAEQASDGERTTIYAVGGDLTAFDPAEPTRPLWVLSAANPQLFAERLGVASRSGIRGRVQAAGDLVVVPGLNDVLLVASRSGKVVERIEVDGPANPTLVGPQLFLGQNGALTALMPAASAERLMRERIEREPQHPEGSLALLDLGLRTKRLDLCLEAAGMAQQSLASHDDAAARDELVDRLLLAGGLDEARGPKGERVHQVLGTVAATSAERVRALLAHSDWLVGRERYGEAITGLDVILGEPALREVEVESATDGVAETEPALAAGSILATARLAQLAGKADDALRSREERAQAKLAALGDDRAALAELCESHPLTAAAVDASVRLAGLVEGRRPAILALLRGWRARPLGPAGDAALARLLAATLERSPSGRTAAELADLVLDTRGPLAVPTAQGSTTVAEIAGRLEPRWPAVGGEPGEAIEIPGHILRLSGMEGGDRFDGVLMVHERSLALREAPSFSPRWTVAVEDRDPMVLLAGGLLGQRMLLWQEGADGEAFASLHDLATGAVVARTPPLREILPPERLLDAGRPPSQLMPNETPYLPSQVLPVLCGDRLVLVRRNGDMVGFDLSDLVHPVWTKERVLDQVYEVGATEWSVALGGRDPGPRGSGPSAIKVIDPERGDLLASRLLGDSEDVRWMRVVANGDVVVGSEGSVEAFDALHADLPSRWRLATPVVRDTVGSWRVGSSLVLADRADGIAAVGLVDGTARPDRFRVPLRNEVRSTSIRAGGRAGGAALIQFEDRVVAFRADGELLGEDAVADERNYLVATPIEGGIVVVNALGSRQVPSPITGGMRTEFAYVVYRLSLGDGLRLLGPGLQVRLAAQRCERVGVVDGYLLLSTNSSTLAVPLPTAGSEGR